MTRAIWDGGDSVWDGGISIWDYTGEPIPISPEFTASYVFVITYDGDCRYAKAIAVNDAAGNAWLVDSGGSTYSSIHEINEYMVASAREGYVTRLGLYPDELLMHAQEDAVGLAMAMTPQRTRR